jgi:hypothetical protein
MNRLIRYLIFIIPVFSFSCEKQGLLIKCEDCLQEEPLEVVINIKIDPPWSISQPVEISIFEGNLEDSILQSRYTTSTTPIALSVLINKKYTVTAKYTRNNIIYVAVDSATPGVIFDSKKCDTPCYIVYDTEMDLRIRYTQ